MKPRTKVKWILLLSFQLPFVLHAQIGSPAFKQLSFSEDNDFINICGRGTDNAYTHGFRMDVRYNKDSADLFFDNWLPSVGAGSTKTYGWALMQTMITPTDLSKRIPDATDYRYACAITVMRSRYAISASKKYATGSEVIMGMMGSPSLGEETQIGIHRLTKSDLPRGWNTEIKTALLININLLFERSLISPLKEAELIGGMKSSVGTYLNAISFYTLLRVGKMNPYFSSVLNRFNNTEQTKNRWRMYGILKPSLDLVAHNALLQGALFRKDKEIKIENGEDHFQESHRTINHIGTSLEYGLVITRGKMAISFSQRSMYAMIKQQPRHQVGNLSVYFLIR